MSEEIREMEETAMEPAEVYDETTDEVEEKSGSKFGVAALIVGSTLAIGGLAVAGVKKLKDKKEGKPKKQKTRLKLVRVPVDEDEEIVEAEDVFEDEVDEETEE